MRPGGYGVGLAAATQWLFNFVITKITPEAVNSIGWRTFLMFGIFCLANAVFVFFFVPETKRMTLEDIDFLFDGFNPEVRQKDVERAMSDAQPKQREVEFNEDRGPQRVDLDGTAKQ